MKTKLTLILTLAITLVFVQASRFAIQSFKVKTYKISVQGSSTLHEWESTVEKFEAKGSFTVENNALTDVRETVVKIPVTSIKSTKGKMMDNKTYEAFNYEKHPDIIFSLSSSKINNANATVDFKGMLTMAGTSKPVDVTAQYKMLSNGDLQITGSKKLRMTDFKMDPPTAMMGTIKVGNDVTVVFDVVITGKATL